MLLSHAMRRQVTAARSMIRSLSTRPSVHVSSAMLPRLTSPPNPPGPLQNQSQGEVLDNDGPGFFSKLYQRYSLADNYERAQRAEEYFQAIAVQANDPSWYASEDSTELRVPLDFRRQHALYTLHLWLIHKRLLHDTHDTEGAPLIQEQLFTIFWDDTLNRIRQQGVYELSVYKNLTKVQQYTWIHLTNYDHVYTEFLQNPQERRMELYKLLQRHFLLEFEQVIGGETDDENGESAAVPEDEEEEDETPPQTNVEELLQKNLSDKSTAILLDRLAWYIDVNYQNLMQDMPDEVYRQARVAWTGVPFDSVATSPWRMNLTTSGKVYYWNPQTMESSWTKPNDVAV